MHDAEIHWPAWPEMTHETGELDPDNARIKREIAAEYGEDSLRRSWLAVCSKLESLTQEIKTKQTEMIPELSYDEFFTLNDSEKERLKNVGCFVVRGTVPEETAKGWFDGLQDYIRQNKGTITGECDNFLLISSCLVTI